MKVYKEKQMNNLIILFLEINIYLRESIQNSFYFQ